MHRGTIATVDGDGRNIVLVWLFDHRGGYGLLMIDAETGCSEQFPMPFPSGGDCPYTCLLSSRNRLYTHFNSRFIEFDPAKRAFTSCRETAPQTAMGMTEDDNGVIWSGTYPKLGLVSFAPETGELTDYGHVHRERWAQYPRFVAADDAGWIYVGVGVKAGLVIGFDPSTCARCRHIRASICASGWAPMPGASSVATAGRPCSSVVSSTGGWPRSVS